MKIIDVTRENLETEHICCAISSNQDIQVRTKKAWLADRLKDGLVFKKCDVRGKCFIEYIPAEKAWAPVQADGYMYINCFWVSGKLKGHGYSNVLLEDCIRDAKEKGKKGLVVLSSKKKRPFLSDPGYLQYKGFVLADVVEPYYRLLYLPFNQTADPPHFRSAAKTATIEEKGFVLFYTHQCPYTAKYVPLVEQIAKTKGIPFRTVRFTTAQQAQNAPAPFTFIVYFITVHCLPTKFFLLRSLKK